MLRFKQFSGSGSDLEQDINGWLGQVEPDVTQMVQTVDASGRVTLGFLFEESFRGQELRLSSEHHGRNAAVSAMDAGESPNAPIQVQAEPIEPPRQA